MTSPNGFSDRERKPQTVRVGSFAEALGRVKERVFLEAFRREDKPQALELCFIIAEAERLPDGTPMQIGGDKLPAELVREVYGLLEYEHLEMVIENFKKEQRELRYKKSYLRTALYNAVFELESHYINQVKADGG